MKLEFNAHIRIHYVQCRTMHYNQGSSFPGPPPYLSTAPNGGINPSRIKQESSGEGQHPGVTDGVEAHSMLEDYIKSLDDVIAQRHVFTPAHQREKRIGKKRGGGVSRLIYFLIQLNKLVDSKLHCPTKEGTQD